MRPIENFSKYIDHTLLRPDATKDDIRRLCEEAIEYNFATVFVSPCYAKLAKEFLKGSDVKLGIPVGFPFGVNLTEIKVLEAKRAVEDGADEIDMVINISALKSGEERLVRDDIAAVVEAVAPVGVKTILETCYLTKEEKIKAVKMSIDAKASFVKTSTGFGPKGADLADIKLIREVSAGRIKIKASGGIRTYQVAKEFILAGASRIGTSTGVEIMKEYLKKQGGKNEDESS